MAIEQSSIPTAPEAARLHGLAFGALDTARKLLTQIETRLGLPITHTDSPHAGEIEDMVARATEMLGRALRHLEGMVEERLPHAPRRTKTTTTPAV